MAYRKFTVQIIVADDQAESLGKSLDTALEQIKQRHTVYLANVSQEESAAPDDPEEVTAPVSEPALGQAAPGEESSDDQFGKG